MIAIFQLHLYPIIGMGADSDPPRLDGDCFSSPRRVPLPYVVLPNAPHFLIRSRVDRLWGVFNTPLQRVYLENVSHFLIRSRRDRLWGVCCCALQRVYLENVPHFLIRSRVDRL